MSFTLVLLFAFALFLAFSVMPMQQRFKDIWLGIFAIVLILLADFRGEGIGKDYTNYVFNFTHLRPPAESVIEPSFFLISYTIKFFTENPVVLFLIYACISISIKWVVIKKISPNYFLSLLIMLSNIYLIQDLTQIRAAVGSSFLLLATWYLVDGDKKKFYIMVVLSIMFHYTSLVLLGFIFIDRHRFNKLLWISIIPIAYFLFFVGLTPIRLLNFIPIAAVQAKINTYILLQEEAVDLKVNVFNTLIIMKTMLIAYLVFQVDKLKELSAHAVFLLKIFILSIAVLIITSELSTLAFRLNEYLSVVEIILIPWLIFLVKPREFGYILVALYAALLFYLHFRAETLLIFVPNHG